MSKQDLIASATAKLTEDELKAIHDLASVQAYRDARRLVRETEAYKAFQIDMLHLSDALADRVTDLGYPNTARSEVDPR